MVGSYYKLNLYIRCIQDTYVYRITVMKDIPLDNLSTTQKSWRRFGSEAVACKHVKDKRAATRRKARKAISVVFHSTQLKLKEMNEAAGVLW